MNTTERAMEIFQERLGQALPPGAWHQVDQAQINQFADATLDHNSIHVDPERAAATPFGSTIAHGFLTLSLISPLRKTIPWPEPNPFEGLSLALNYGVDRVRFMSPVTSGSRIRARLLVLDAELKAPKTIHLKQQITVELEGQEKPACVAVWILRLIYDS